MGKVKQFFSSYGRYLLAAVGVTVIALLIYKIGPREVLATVVGAGAWLPLILALDFCWLAVEGLALLVIYGEQRKQISLRDWIQATLVQYASFVILPMGRVSSEVARAGVLGPIVGKSRAAAGAALMQSLTLMTNGLVSALCLLVLFLTAWHTGLSALLTFNLFATGGVGVVLYLVLRHVRIGGFLGKRFQRLSQFGPDIDVHVKKSASQHLPAFGFCLLGRGIQTLQYGVIVFAVMGSFSVTNAIIAEGIQVVARSMGDAVPNQVGVTEGVFALCAGALSLADHPEKAISIALLGRVSNLSVAGLCALGLQLLPRATRVDREVVSISK